MRKKNGGWITNPNGSHHYFEPHFTPKPGPKLTEAYRDAEKNFASWKSTSSGSGGVGGMIATGALIVVGLVGLFFGRKK